MLPPYYHNILLNKILRKTILKKIIFLGTKNIFFDSREQGKMNPLINKNIFLEIPVIFKIKLNIHMPRILP